jgi:hypothetical protein
MTTDDGSTEFGGGNPRRTVCEDAGGKKGTLSPGVGKLPSFGYSNAGGYRRRHFRQEWPKRCCDRHSVAGLMVGIGARRRSFPLISAILCSVVSQYRALCG